MEKPKTQLKNLPITSLTRGKYQTRAQFDSEQLHEMAQSIRENGLIQPIIVRPISEDQYEIVAGERRWRAAQIARLDSVPCLLNHYSDEQTAAITTIENVQRQDLNPIEEALAYERLTKDFGYIHEEIAAVVGKSRSKITNSLRLLKLIPYVKNLLQENMLSEGHAKVLAGLTDQQQQAIAEECVSKSWSVRQLESRVKKLNIQSPMPDKAGLINIRRLEAKLGDHLGSKTSIDFNTNEKGQLIIDFHNIEALEGIFNKLRFQYEDYKNLQNDDH